MQKEIIEKTQIFDRGGLVTAAGWSRCSAFEYNYYDSKMSKKIDERNCYFISTDEISMYITAENLGRYILIKIAIADLKRGGVISDFIIKKSIFSKYPLPESITNGELLYSDKRVNLQIINTIEKCILKCDFINFGGLKNLYFNISLNKINGESLEELAPFERNRKYFYFKKFAPGFSANGIIRIGGREYSLNEINSNAYFDMTRFSKPRKHNYQRLAAACMLDGKRFSLSLASRVGDNRLGNENCYFIDGKLFKLSQINVNSPGSRLDRPWYFKGGISALDIMFKPFTIKGEALAAYMEKTSVIFGRLYGTINHFELRSPVNLDNTQAHIVLSEF